MTHLDLQDTTSFTPLFQKILNNRGFIEATAIEQYISGGLESLTDPFQMKGMDVAVDLIRGCIDEQKTILIHGDYDVDGVTATALVSRTLEVLGAPFIPFVPDRMQDGYGVSERAIRENYEKGARLLITADCGVTAHSQIAAARSMGMDVVVIDHHRIPEEGLPNANAILNPRREDCSYPCKELSAAGLAFKLSQALIGERAFSFLDLAALSTVCDVAPLVEENRVIVKKGLEVLSKRSNPGIQALSSEASIKVRDMNVGHIGFMLGPRINAAGRMSSPEIALRLLMTSSDKEAKSLASILEQENKERQKEERQTLKEAVAIVEQTINFTRDRVIVVGKEGWHAGVIGIVAARLVDKFNRPAVVIAFEQGEGKGSGRSIKGFHLFNAMASCKDLFESFGGHEQAAGLSMSVKNLEVFRKQINEFAAKEYEGKTFKKKIPVEMDIALEDLRPGFVRELKLMEPHGVGNARPTFQTKGLQIKSVPKKLSPQTLKLWLTDGIFTLEALWSDRSREQFPALTQNTTVDVIYAVKTKVWDGIESLVLEVKDLTLA